ncbi:hypothetical protein KP509_16G062900 [Ceratopteris richardii]|nr:hypothetical protein KP509_16G062900 [Ceratopteris richardii]
MLSLKPVTGEYGNHIHNSPAQHELHFKSQVADFQARNNTGLKSFDDIVNDLFDWKQAYDAMKFRLENAERALEKHSLVDTGMYKGDATPALLQRRADAVKFDIQMCAAAIIEFAEINSFPVESPSHLKRMIVPFDHLEGAKKLQLTRMLLEASLCEFMFQGFESANYSITLDGNTSEVFDTPTALKRRRLHLFNHFFQEDPQKMQERNECFRMFCQLKISTVIESLFSELVRSHDRFREIAEDGTRKEFPCQNYLSRLAKSVWLLHKVAFSFEPASAEIFRVPPSSCFAKEYMQEEEDIRPTLSCDERERKVAFMTVPGFTLRNSVIKAYVCCVDSLIS